MKPMKHNVLVKIEAVEKKTKSGLFLPETPRHDNLHGEILSTGSATIEVKVGDKVIFAKLAQGHRFIEDGVEKMILSEKDILAVIS